MSNYHVSVIIPAYNAANYLAEAVMSVLTQNLAPSEVIIVNDGSTDQTEAVARSFGAQIKLINQENQGISVARNVGMREAQGDFMAFQDADDIWLPTKLAKQIEYLDCHPAIQLVFSLAQNRYHRANLAQDQPGDDQFSIVAAYIPGTCLFRREVINSIGWFDPTIKLGEFADWYARALQAHIGIGHVPSRQLIRRIHGQNIGIRNKHHQNEYLKILKRKIDQERTART